MASPTMESVESPSLFDLYRETISRISPSLTAVIYDDGRLSREVTYEELDRQVTSLADLLLPVASRKVVACYCGKNLLTLPVILGILKVHSAFCFMKIEKDILENDALTAKVKVSSDNDVSNSRRQKLSPQVHKNQESFNNFQKPDTHNLIDDQLWNVSKFVPIGAIIVDENYEKVAGFHLCTCWNLYDEICFSTKLKIYTPSKSCCSVHQKSCNFHKWQDLTCNESLAYVAFTTGTTGQSKVVQVPHSCIVPNITHFRSIFSLTTNDVIVLSPPMTFDPSIVDVFLSLSVGSSLVIIPDHIKRIPRAFGDLILNKNVTVFQACPSFLLSFGTTYLRNYLLSEDTPLRILALGGERCPSIEKLKAIRNPKCPTRVFNVYGVTEVSCWATCKEIYFDDKNSSSEISLGSPLAETLVYACDENNELIEEGFGQLFVGSSTRYCIINDEEINECQKPRATGDWVYKTKGEIFYNSRKDGVVKYFGRKLALSVFDSCLDNLSFITNHFIKYKDPILCIFVILKQECSFSQNEATSLILENLQKCSTLMPAVEIFCVPCIPVNRNGKVDHRKLLDYFETKTRSISEKKTREKLLIKADIINMVSSLWGTHTSVHDISENDNYITSGGNSISALQFVSEIECQMHEMFPTLINVLINKTFHDVINSIVAAIPTKIFQYEPKKVQHSTEFNQESPLKASEALKNLPPKNSINEKLCHIEVTRRGYRESCFCGSCNFETILKSSFDEDSAPSIKMKYSLGKCIDGSICAAYYSKFDSIHFFCGSHSGKFASVNTEKLLWEVTLPDRVESSPCLSACGLFVLVGCYDKHLYCFNAFTGAIKWKKETGGEVKSSPVVSPKNVAYVGSHDKYLHAVLVETGSELWKKKISDGSIFSSPAISSNYVCAASLDGVVASLDQVSGDVIWRCDYGKPFFSSPLISNSYIYIGCVDGNVLQFDSAGNMVRKYVTGGPIFSSPAKFAPINGLAIMENIVVGSHNSKLVCYSISGNLLWTYHCDSPVYCTPLSFIGKNGQTYVIAASSTGRLFILDSETGAEILTHDFPNEVFSSAVVLKDSIALGCRDNNIYVLGM